MKNCLPFCCVLFVCLLANRLCAEGDEIPDKVYSSRIMTVQFHRSGVANSIPFFELGSGDQLSLTFDMLGASAKNFQYTIVHCDADWHPSNLLQSEYINGIFQDYVSQFSFSSKTYEKYVHY